MNAYVFAVIGCVLCAIAGVWLTVLCWIESPWLGGFALLALGMVAFNISYYMEHGRLP